MPSPSVSTLMNLASSAVISGVSKVWAPSAKSSEARKLSLMFCQSLKPASVSPGESPQPAMPNLLRSRTTPASVVPLRFQLIAPAPEVTLGLSRVGLGTGGPNAMLPV